MLSPPPSSLLLRDSFCCHSICSPCCHSHWADWQVKLNKYVIFNNPFTRCSVALWYEVTARFAVCPHFDSRFIQRWWTDLKGPPPAVAHEQWLLTRETPSSPAVCSSVSSCWLMQCVCPQWTVSLHIRTALCCYGSRWELRQCGWGVASGCSLLLFLFWWVKRLLPHSTEHSPF